MEEGGKTMTVKGGIQEKSKIETEFCNNLMDDMKTVLSEHSAYT